MTNREKYHDVWKSSFHMLSREELYMLDIIGLSDMIMSIEHAVRYIEGYRFLLLCFGDEGSSEKANAIMKDLEAYLQQIKDVHRFKINEKRKRADFLRGENA